MTTRTKKTISLVVPFFNEGEAISDFQNAVCGLMDGLGEYEFEIVCVDDGSQDDTLFQLIALADQDRRFIVIELSRNFGKEAALTAGLDAASGDAVIPIDADLQDPPELIRAMIHEWEAGAEVVLARRTDRSADSLLKRKSAQIFYRIHNSLSNIKIPENVGDFRLIDRVAVDALKRLPEQQRFMKGLFAWVGFKTVTLDYARKSRIAGTTKFSGWKLWNFALEGVTSFSTVPLRLWSYIGIIGTLIAILYLVFVVIRTLIYGIDVPGYASLLVVVLFFGSLQLISVGVLGEYIGRIYMESKRRPLYLIRKRYGKVQ